jgi:DNA-directed RNA polymerase subunit RPC12/RpoP
MVDRPCAIHKKVLCHCRSTLSEYMGSWGESIMGDADLTSPESQQLDDATPVGPPPVPPPHVAGTTQEAGQTFDDGEGRIFPCDGCGADLEFHIGQQSLKCPFCGFTKEIELDADAAVAEQDFHAMLEKLREWHQRRREKQLPAEAESHEMQELRCDSCGGTVEFIGTLTSTHCPYCGSPVQLEKAHKSDLDRIPVDGVLPFQVERKAARANLKSWVDSRWFAPNEFRKRGAEGKFNGVYLSYFTYDTLTHNVYAGQRGEYYYVTVGSGKNKRRVRKTRWWPASGKFQRFFDDVLVLANTGLRRDFMLALEPWPLQKLVPFNQQMLSGLLARTYDLELEKCFQEAKARVDQAIHADVCSRIGGDTQRVSSINTRYDAITFKHLLLPVWLLAYRYGDKSYQVFINAATGEVQGERPYSAWKIAFAVLGGLLAAGGIFLMSQS